jgi:hypothetical protein
MSIWRTFGVVVHEDELEDVAVDVVDRVEVRACITRHARMHENESRVEHKSTSSEPSIQPRRIVYTNNTLTFMYIFSCITLTVLGLVLNDSPDHLLEAALLAGGRRLHPLLLLVVRAVELHLRHNVHTSEPPGI